MMFIPFGGGIGLWLAYRALRNARDTGEAGGSERMARAAVIVGWIGLCMHVIPLCLVLAISGTQASWNICSALGSIR
jgi:hypothetical protein